MHSLTVAILFGICITPCHAEQPAADEKAIRAVLDAQATAWNKGDIDGFMKGYWKDEKLTFISGDRITQGWNATRERYVKRYQAGGKDKMGTLSFDELHIEGFGPDAAKVTGRFKLVRGDQTDNGRFTLLLRKQPEGWRIVHDHTSVGEKPEKPMSERAPAPRSVPQSRAQCDTAIGEIIEKQKDIASKIGFLEDQIQSARAGSGKGGPGDAAIREQIDNQRKRIQRYQASINSTVTRPPVLHSIDAFARLLSQRFQTFGIVNLLNANEQQRVNGLLATYRQWIKESEDEIRKLESLFAASEQSERIIGYMQDELGDYLKLSEQAQQRLSRLKKLRDSLPPK